jgi:hypothetical protein
MHELEAVILLASDLLWPLANFSIHLLNDSVTLKVQSTRLQYSQHH